MNFLRRLSGGLPNKMHDSVLGPLARRDDHWAGCVTWEHSPLPFALSIHRAEAIPSPSDRTAFEALKHDYPALCAALQEALFDLWRSARRFAVEPQSLNFGEPLALWTNLHLQGVGQYQDSRLELIYGFSDPTHPEGAFLVSVRGRTVKPLEYIE